MPVRITRRTLLRGLGVTLGLPPLEAYPESQRGRIDTMLKELPLRDPVTGMAPVKTKA